MPEYRLYCMDGTGRIAEAEWFDARTDDEAIVIARAKKLGVACEIWKREHLIKKIEAHSAKS